MPGEPDTRGHLFCVLNKGNQTAAGLRARPSQGSERETPDEPNLAEGRWNHGLAIGSELAPHPSPTE